MMKKYLLCVAILASGLTARAQETVYVCQGQTYQAIAVTSVGDITFSADGSVVNIGTNGSFKTADVDSITFALPTFATKAGEKEILVAYSCSNATVTMGSAVKAVKSTVSGANVTLSSSTDDTEYTHHSARAIHTRPYHLYQRDNGNAQGRGAFSSCLCGTYHQTPTYR